MTTPKFVVMYSGGAGSWAAARRIVDRHGAENVVLLFADTNMEDKDLYRFVAESVAKFGCELVRLADGRDVWQVFSDERFIGNSLVDPCSKILKRQLMDKWRERHCDRLATTLVFGLDWSEQGRIEGSHGVGGLRRRMEATGWKSIFPLNDRPYLTKADILDLMRADGLDPPRLYGMGWPHNNCGGFCVKAGLGQFRHLLRVMPERYRYHEEREAETMAIIGPTAIPFLRLRRGGTNTYLTMKEFRVLCESEPSLGLDHGWGCGGGCAIDDHDQEAKA